MKKKELFLYIMFILKYCIALMFLHKIIAYGDLVTLVHKLSPTLLDIKSVLQLVFLAGLIIINSVIVKEVKKILKPSYPQKIIIYSVFMDLIILFSIFYYEAQLAILTYGITLREFIMCVAPILLKMGMLLYFTNFAIVKPYCIMTKRSQ